MQWYLVWVPVSPRSMAWLCGIYRTYGLHMYRVGRVYLWGYDVHYRKITQNNNKRRAEFKQGSANPVFSGGALFSTLLLAGTDALWFYKLHPSLNKRSPDNAAASNQAWWMRSSSSVQWGFFSQFQPANCTTKFRKHRLWVCAEHALCVWRIWERASSPKTCWCFSKAAPPCPYLLCVTRKQTSVSAVASAQDVCYPRSLDPTPCFLLSL